ncbi:COX11 [Cordylochernes scorpioides]|uniref:COX11 n=1 Tax=Cordylochernes scorpioides TaxID=51811 RepID=A0ABY6LEZ3_9ARAC|nr:COX11 [Cordylochernes scorpioides]
MAFYTVENLSDEPVKGIASYNILPTEVGPYFNKIQQNILASIDVQVKSSDCRGSNVLPPEVWLFVQVDLPVYFYIDSEFDDDPNLSNVKEVTLSYSFSKSTPNTKLPLPNFMRPKV